MTWPAIFAHWSFDASVIVGIALAAILYWRGMRGSLTLVNGGRRTTERRWRAVAFYAGLVAVFIALESPLDYYTPVLFWVHMVQHLLLIMIAAPLLVIGDAAVPFLRATPLGPRRRTLDFIIHRPSLRSLWRGLVWLGSPAPVFVIFLVDMYLWHWNRLFNLTLQNNAVHLAEHICFLVTALLLWRQVIDQRAMHRHLTYAQRVLYTIAVAAGSNLLAMYFVFSPRPLYSVYAHLQSRPLGMTALSDQQLAGGIMWVPVLFLFGGAAMVYFYKLLGQDDQIGDEPAFGTYSVLTSSADPG